MATVFGMGDPNFPGFTSAPGLGSASARGFIAPSVRCFRICSIVTPLVLRANARCLGSVPASVELPRVVSVFHAHTAHKTSEFLDPIEQTDVVPLDSGRSVGSLIFHGTKAEEIQTVRIASSLRFVPCGSTWGESCPISLPAAPGRGVAANPSASATPAASSGVAPLGLEHAPGAASVVDSLSGFHSQLQETLGLQNPRGCWWAPTNTTSTGPAPATTRCRFTI